jgi:hypothetical protein
LRVPDPQRKERTFAAEALVERTQEYKGAVGLVVSVVNPKRLNGLRQWLLREHLGQHQVSLEPFCSSRREHKREKISDFYRQVVSDFDDRWMIERKAECLIVTTRARWVRNINGITVLAVGDGTAGPYSLKELLPHADIGQAEPGKVLLASPPSRRVAESSEIQPGILDGPEALRSWEHVLTDSVLILLEQSEFDEEAGQTISLLAGARTDSNFPKIGCEELNPLQDVSLLDLA